MPVRLRSLDVFRGITMALMLLVNNIALDVDTPAQLLHADLGQGVHAADLVFPWFLLIGGVAMPFSAAAWAARGGTAAGWRRKSAKRAVNLFLLGCLIDISLYKQFNIYMDVLQLIAVAWFGASLFLGLRPGRRAGLAIFLLAWHWALCRWLPPPGAPQGWFHDDWNILAYIDFAFLSKLRMWGLTAAVPTVALVLYGTLAGEVLQSGRDVLRRLSWLALAGVATGALLSLSIPFSKTWWTSSYILYTGGWGMALLAVLHYGVDVRSVERPFFPLTVFGMNAMAVYIGPILFKLYTLQQWTVRLSDGVRVSLQDALMNAFYHHFGRYPGGWIYTLTYILCCWLAAFWLYRKRLFWRV